MTVLMRFVALHFKGGAWVLLRRYTWEWPQTMLGFWAGVVAILRAKKDLGLKAWGGVLVLKSCKQRRFWGGVSFGSVIIGDSRISAEVNNELFMHEFGHVLQSRAYGPIYLTRFGLPSLISARSGGVHHQHPVEQDANIRANAFFRDVNGFTRWPMIENPILPGAVQLRPGFWEYLPGPSPFLHLLWAFLQWRKGRN